MNGKSPHERRHRNCCHFHRGTSAETLQYWLNELNLPAKIEFAPYNQVLQTLLDTRGLFALNRNGLNVVLVRLEDCKAFNEVELITALKTGASIAASPILVCVCPPTPATVAGQLELDLETALAGFPTTRFLSSARLLELYPVSQYYDPAADKLGHIPYTPEAYAALGTAIARVFHASQRAPYKVIVLIAITPCGGASAARARKASSWMRPLGGPKVREARQQEGMLLCVCSKNASEDVEQAFDATPVRCRSGDRISRDGA